MRPLDIKKAHAGQYQQKGWIANTSSGISLHIESSSDLQQKFLAELKNTLPPFAQIKSLTSEPLPLENFPHFTIKPPCKNPFSCICKCCIN
jgi:hydrogenase maturation factor HypF (carbamoyltransferase family)